MGNSITAQRIYQHRKLLGVTQEKLALLAGTTQKQISKYESGFNVPDTKVLKRIADVFNVSIDYLLGITDFEEPKAIAELTQNESKILGLLRLLTDKQQNIIFDIIKEFSQSRV